MLGDFVPLLVALTLAASLYIFRERHRQRSRVHPRFPDLTMKEAWEMLGGQAGAHPDEAFLPESLCGGAVPPGVEEEVLRALFENEAQWPAGGGRRILREAILASASTALHLEALLAYGETERQGLLRGYLPGMGDRLAEAAQAAVLEWAALRRYAQWKYDDAAAEDWFQHFLRIARPYIREKVRLARDFVMQTDEGARRFAEIYDALLEALRRQALQAPPKKRFPPPDLPL